MSGLEQQSLSEANYCFMGMSVVYLLLSPLLLDSVKQWKAEGRKAVWLHVPILQSKFIAAAAEQGFTFHHAESDSATMTLWLGEGVSKLPHYATHQLGVAGKLREDKLGEAAFLKTN